MPNTEAVAKVASQLIKFAPQIIGIVKGVRALFGHSKSGPEKLEIAKETAKSTVLIAEGIAGHDLVNDVAIDALTAEAVELGYQAMKIEDRIEAIREEIKRLKPGTGSSTPTP